MGCVRIQLYNWKFQHSILKLVCDTLRQNRAPPGQKQGAGGGARETRRLREDGAGTDLIAVRAVVADDSQNEWLLVDGPGESGLRTPLEMTGLSQMGPANPITLYCVYEAWCVIQFEENRGASSAWESSHSAKCRCVSGEGEILQGMCWLHLAGCEHWCRGECDACRLLNCHSFNK